MLLLVGKSPGASEPGMLTMGDGSALAPQPLEVAEALSGEEAQEDSLCVW